MDNPYYERLVNAAIRLVSFRPRSEKELREFLSKKLTKWKVSGSGLLDKVIIRMEELGYIDDKKFARWWVEQRSTFRPKGNRAIEYELMQKGIAMELISEALIGRNSVDAAKKALKNKQFDKKKQFEYLLRRGFDVETIKKVQ